MESQNSRELSDFRNESQGQVTEIIIGIPLAGRNEAGHIRGNILQGLGEIKVIEVVESKFFLSSQEGGWLVVSTLLPLVVSALLPSVVSALLPSVIYFVYFLFGLPWFEELEKIDAVDGKLANKD